MAQSSAAGRPTRASTRTSAKPAPSAGGAQKTGKRAATTNVAKGSKRQTPTKAATTRKRLKRDDSDEEDKDQEEESDDDGDEQDSYKDEGSEDDQDDDEEEEESDMDDFQDTNYGKGKGKAAGRTSTKASRSTSTSSSTKQSKKKGTAAAASKSSKSSSSMMVASINPDLLPAPSKQFLVSTLKIPRPPKPTADAIQPETLEFLRDLKLNNDREYFQLNEARWLAAKNDFVDFIRMLKEGLLEADPDVMNQEPKDSMTRIYRDVRFSNDKSPYKSELACVFSKGGKKSIAACYYFGLSPDGKTFAGCGLWDPSSAVLQRVRQGIVNNSERFKAVLETDAIKRVTGGKTGLAALQPGPSQLKTGPAGYDKDHPMIEFLKRKCFAIGRRFTDEEAVNEGFLEEILLTFDACVDLVHILNEWIG